MPYYSYEVRTKDGKLSKGQTFSVNKTELVRLLQREDYLIVSIKEASALADRHRRKLHGKAKAKDLIIFSKELAILLENGVTITEAIDVILLQVESSTLISALKTIKKGVEAGTTLRNSMAKFPRIFTGYWLDMIDAGEISGQLPFVLKQISAFIEAREEVRKKTVTAFMYPILLTCVAVFAVFIFVFRIVPIFQDLFTSFGAKLPTITIIVIKISDLSREYFPYLVLLAILAGFVLRRMLSTRFGRIAYETVLLGTPVVGELSMALAIERFSSTLSSLLKSGIPIVRALEVVAKTSGNVLFGERIEEAKVKVISGLPFSEALYQTGLFPPLAVQLVMVGEKTGNFSGMLDEVSKYYKDVIDVAVARFTALIGPVILMFMAVIIGGLVAAMFLPIFKFATVGGA